MIRAITVLATLLLLPVLEASGQTIGTGSGSKKMRSQEYCIEWSTTSLGGTRMQSKQYLLKGTLGQVAIKGSKSKNYELKAGFWPATAKLLKRKKPLPPT